MSYFDVFLIWYCLWYFLIFFCYFCFYNFGFIILNKYSIVCGIFKVFFVIYWIDKKRNICKNVMWEDYLWIWEFV